MNSSAYAVFNSSSVDGASPCDFHGQFPPELCDERRVRVNKVGLKSFKTQVQQVNVTNLPSYVYFTEEEKVVTRTVSGKESLVFDNNFVTGQVVKGAPSNPIIKDALFLLFTSKDATSPLKIKISQPNLLLTNEVKFLLPPRKTLYFQLAEAPVYSGSITMQRSANTEIASVLDTFIANIPPLRHTEAPIDLKILTKKTEWYELTPTHHHGSGGYYFKLSVKALKPCRVSINKDFLYKLVAENDGGVYDLAAGDTKTIQFDGLIARAYYPIELKMLFEKIVSAARPPKRVSFALKSGFFRDIASLTATITTAMDKAFGKAGMAYFKYLPAEAVVEFDNNNAPRVKKVVLSKNLQRVFGFESNVLIASVKAVSAPDLHIPMEEVYVYADVVTQSYVDGNYKNLLGIVPMKFKSPDFYYHLEQPLYFDVAPSTTTMGMFANRAIKFSLRDRHSNEIAQIIGPTTITLEFVCSPPAV